MSPPILWLPCRLFPKIRVMKFKFLTILASFFYCFTPNVIAQNAKDIAGHVVDHVTNERLPFCSVVLHAANDSTVITGTLSSENGDFTFSKLLPGRYYLTTEFVGYHADTTLLPDNAWQGTPIIIRLKANVQVLETVHIRANASPVQTLVDRQVLTADKVLTAQGGTAMDLIRNAPSISVDALGNILWRGSNAFLVLLNGKPVQTNPQQFLSQLPVNSIDRIELITNPSAKLDPDGKGGILNIITKTSVSGDSFSIGLQGGLPSFDTHQNSRTPIRMGGDFALFHRKNRWEVNVGANYLRNDMSGHRSGDVNTTIGDVHTSFPSEGERSFLRYSYTARGAITYTPDSSNTWSLGVYAGNRMQSRRADIVYHNTQTRLSDPSFRRDFTYYNSNVARKSSQVQLANLDYTRVFRNGSSITASGLYERAAIESHTFNINLNEPQRDYAFQTTDNPSSNPLHAVRANLDYTLPISTGKLETGYQFRIQEQRGRFDYLVREGTEPWVLIPEFSSHTKVDNRIHSTYALYSGKTTKLTYSGGLRYEYAEREFTAGNGDARNLTLHNLFPSAALLYQISTNAGIKGGYNRRIQRSTNHELNPFPEREHSETLESGDPNILPELIDLTELGVILTPSWGSWSVSFYNQQIKNVVNRVNRAYNDTIIERIYTNAGRAVSWGVETSINSNISKVWQLFASMNVYRYQIRGSLFDESVKVNSSGPVFAMNTTNSFRVSPTVQLQWSASYLSERITAQGEDSRFLLSSLSARKTFLGGKLAATLQWQNMDLGLLRSNQQRITTRGSNFYTTTNYIHETDMVLLNLNYTFNQLPKKSRLPKSEFSDREF
jgi:ferric enterobactin receptor